jgi:hypothetical protein
MRLRCRLARLLSLSFATAIAFASCDARVPERSLTKIETPGQKRVTIDAKEGQTLENVFKEFSDQTGAEFRGDPPLRVDKNRLAPVVTFDGEPMWSAASKLAQRLNCSFLVVEDNILFDSFRGPYDAMQSLGTALVAVRKKGDDATSDIVLFRLKTDGELGVLDRVWTIDGAGRRHDGKVLPEDNPAARQFGRIWKCTNLQGWNKGHTLSGSVILQVYEPVYECRFVDLETGAFAADGITVSRKARRANSDGESEEHEIAITWKDDGVTDVERVQMLRWFGHLRFGDARPEGELPECAKRYRGLELIAVDLFDSNGEYMPSKSTSIRTRPDGFDYILTHKRAADVKEVRCRVARKTLAVVEFAIPPTEVPASTK